MCSAVSVKLQACLKAIIAERILREPILREPILQILASLPRHIAAAGAKNH
jgi:hypothetical protein